MSHGHAPDGCWGYEQHLVFGTIVTDDARGHTVKPRSDSISTPACSLWRCDGCNIVRACFGEIGVEYDPGRERWVGDLQDIASDR